jgi:hypothetical protein
VSRLDVDTGALVELVGDEAKDGRDDQADGWQGGNKKLMKEGWLGGGGGAAGKLLGKGDGRRKVDQADEGKGEHNCRLLEKSHDISDHFGLISCTWSSAKKPRRNGA